MVFERNKQKWVMKIICIVLISLISASIVSAHGISDSDKQSMLEGGYLEYVNLGASHMLTGYDHLLFLFGVIFFLSKFKDIVKFITAFTLGHSITLIFATFLEISANYFLVDAVIALTVLYKGFDNLDGFRKYLQMKSPNLIMLVFSFGLIHGFGLSTRLQQLPLGDEGLLLKIISFNIGVEFGQIIALTVMLFVLATWRKTESFNRFSTASNFGLICAGSLLFLMQMHEYSHQVQVDESLTSQISQNQRVLNSTSGNLSEKEDAANPSTTQREDSARINIPAGKGLEYKFHILKGALLEYAWETNGDPIFYDFHGEAKGENTGYPKDYEETFKEGTDSKSSGSLTVPFEGSHGWWWKNKSSKNIVITLKTTGAYEIIGNPANPKKDQWKDSITIDIPAGKGLEYKFHILKGASLEYTWETNGDPIFYDFHGEAKGENTGYPKDHEETFKEGTDSQSSGSIHVPFEGSHGWWWKNKGSKDIVITLKTNGSYEILGIR